MLILFISTFIYVFLKAMQQQHVIGGHYGWIVPTSFAMAACEVTIVLNVVAVKTLWAALPMGVGGGAGAVLAMYLHRKFIA